MMSSIGKGTHELDQITSTVSSIGRGTHKLDKITSYDEFYM
jgi:hypothetical protein